MEQVTAETNVHDLIERHPELAQVFEEHDLELDVQCLDKADNTLDDASAICGFDAQEMLEALNQKSQNETEEHQ
jgi:hypothetical protein